MPSPFPAHPLVSLLASLGSGLQGGRQPGSVGEGLGGMADLLTAMRRGLEDSMPPTSGGRALLIHAGGCTHVTDIWTPLRD
jgi:hypothetical protein